MSTDDGESPKQPRGRRTAVVVPLPERRELRKEHVEHLRGSGLSDETIALAELYSEGRLLVLGDMLGRTYTRHCGAAIVFPFYLPGETAPHAYRIRPDRPRVEKRRNGKERPVKYDQAASHGVLVYYPPRARAGLWYADVTRPLYWTEGEKKALTLDQLGLATVGLTGVWNWKDPNAEGDRLHPRILPHVDVRGRVCVICFDADAARNDKVMMAAQRLAGVLLAAGAAAVLFVAPPNADGAPKGIDDYYVAHGEEATRALLATAAPIEPADPELPLQKLRRVRALEAAPLDEGLLLPESYSVQRDGSLWVAGRTARSGDTRIAHRGMYPTRRLIDVYSSEIRYELAYVDDASGGWQSRSVTGRAATDARALLAELGPYGAPVSSNSAGKIVDWLEAYVHVNARVLGEVASVSTTGWHVIGGEKLFVTHKPLTKDGSTMELALDTRGDRRKLQEAFVPRGDYNAHLDALRRAWNADPICAAAICAALAVPLIEPLGAGNFGLHLMGDSSRGKTSMLKIAASLYGNPSSAQWVASWNVTAVGAEFRAAMLCDMPNCYDEVGGADPQAVERLVYALINGGGRTRGQRDMSMRETLSWRTIVLSTGERELSDEGAATGAQVRVLTLPVPGFGNLTGGEIDALREQAEANSGHVGHTWLTSLVEGVNDGDSWKGQIAEYQRGKTALRGMAKGNLHNRIAAYFALLMSTESIAAEVLGLGLADGGTMRQLFLSLPSREPVSDAAERALDLVRDWMAADPDAFPELEPGPSGGYLEPKSRAGKTRAGFRRDDGAVLLIPAAFRAFCKGHRLAAREVLRGWSRQGLLTHDVQRLDKVTRLGKTLLRLHTLSLPTAATPEGLP